MKLVAPHRSLRQKSILQFPFQLPRPSCDAPIGLAASDRRTGMGLHHLPLVFPACGLFRRKTRTGTVPAAIRSFDKENEHELHHE